MSHKPPPPIDPPDFRPINPCKSEGLTIRRRNLPHLEVPGATYFVTYRCQSERQLPPEARTLVLSILHACDGQLIDLDAAVVMPDHAHAIFRLNGAHRLSHVLQRIKGRSARRINQMLKTKGPLWMDEGFDHIIRDSSDLMEKIEYIKQNPVKDGLVNNSSDYKWLFAKNYA
jgi:REP element-mobilizing transposase RayT